MKHYSFRVVEVVRNDVDKDSLRAMGFVLLIFSFQFIFIHSDVIAILSDITSVRD